MTSILPDDAVNPGKSKKYTINGVVDTIWDSPASTSYIVKNADVVGGHTYIIDLKSGKDTINYSDDSDALIFRESDFENLVFVKNKNDLIIKQDNKNTTTLKGFFTTTRETDPLDDITTYDSENNEIQNSILLDAFIQTSGSKKIIGLMDYNNKLVGGKKADKIYGGEKENILIGGKGNDTYYLASADNNSIYIRKGDGNDTVVMNETGSSDGIPEIYFDAGVSFTYTKSGNDLIIKAVHSGKKVVSESVKIKDYFTENAIAENIKLFSGETEIDLSNGITNDLIVVGTKVNKNKYEYNGTEYADRITGTTVLDVINAGNGNNIVTTGKKGGDIIYTGEGDDKIIVTNFAQGVVISDDGGSDILQINGINAKDIRFVVDYASDDLLLTDSKGVKALKDLGFFDENADLEKYAKQIRGVLIKDYSDTGKIETIQVADSKGKNVHTLSNTDIESVIKQLKDGIQNFIEYDTTAQWDMGLNKFFDEEEWFESVQDLYSRQTTGMTPEEKGYVKEYKQDIKDIFYNAYMIGSNGNDTFTLNQSQMTIYSGKGSDRFEKNNKSDTDVYIYSDCTDADKSDIIKIKNYSIESGDVEVHGWYNYSALSTMNYLSIGSVREKVKLGSINYYVNTDKEFDGLKITDSKRTYDVVFNSTWDYESNTYTNQNASYEYDWSNDNKNHLAFFDMYAKDLTIKSNNGYNRIEMNLYQNSNKYNLDYTYGGGHDMIDASNSSGSDDKYRVDMSGKVYLDIYDKGGKNDLIISNLKGGVNNLRVFFDVNYQGGTYGEKYFMTADNLKKSNFSIAKDSFDLKDGIDYEGNLSTLNVNENEIDFNSTYKQIVQEVTAWLNNGNKYIDSIQVLKEGNKSEINAMLAIYNKSFNAVVVSD